MEIATKLADKSEKKSLGELIEGGATYYTATKKV